MSDIRLWYCLRYSNWMVSSDSRTRQAKLRLRDNADPLDCFDLSRQSSSLLSPSLYPQIQHDSLENEFPFQVSPTDSFSTQSQHRSTVQSFPQISRSQNSNQRSQWPNTPLSPLTNLGPGSITSPWSTALSIPAALAPTTCTPRSGAHLTHDGVSKDPPSVKV